MKVTKEQKQREQNKRYKTLIKNGFKKIEEASLKVKQGSGNSQELFENLESFAKQAQKNVDKAARKGIIHKKNASRKVRRIFNIRNSVKFGNSNS